jgi:ABC-type phosphate/phosphonate transport system substrate-binding protein
MRTRIASLGMYVDASQKAANDSVWAAIARVLRTCGVADVPERLDRGRPVQDVWRDPDLLFGQICGFPLVSNPTLGLRVIGMPIYDAPECADGMHRSLIVTRQGDARRVEDYRGRRVAINDRGSNTGMNLLRAAVLPHVRKGRFFGDVIESGAHRRSIAAILRSEADIAAIDAITYAAVLRAEPELARTLQIIATTAAAATPPFVTARGTDAATIAALQAALAEVIADPALADARQALFLTDIVAGGTDRYRPLLALQDDAIAAGYPTLR